MAAEEQQPSRREMEMADVLALLRRTLIRLNTVEQRLAGLEERQHDLDDLAMEVRGMQRLVDRRETPETKFLRQLDQRVNEAMNRRLDNKLANMIDRRVRKLLDSE